MDSLSFIYHACDFDAEQFPIKMCLLLAIQNPEE